MSNYVIVSDATFDLPLDIIQKYDIRVIPMAFELNNTSYLHYPDERQLTIEEFYSALKEGGTACSSQITPTIYENFIGDILKEGYDVLYLSFSSGLSGTYNSARVAFSELEEEYPDRKLLCVDTLCASIGEGLLVYHAALKKEAGMSMEEVATWATTHRHNIRHWFTVKDLFHLKRGGRVSGIEALVGTALKIRPVLTVDLEGKLAVNTKVRGSKKELEFLMNKLIEEGVDTKEQSVIIGHGDNLEQAKQLETMLRENNLVKDVIITNIGPVIGTHTGPGMLALTFLGKY